MVLYVVQLTREWNTRHGKFHRRVLIFTCRLIWSKFGMYNCLINTEVKGTGNISNNSLCCQPLKNVKLTARLYKCWLGNTDHLLIKIDYFLQSDWQKWKPKITHLSGVKWVLLSETFCLLSVVCTVGAVELLTVSLSTSHETIELSELAGHEWEDETVLLNSVSSVLDTADCKRLCCQTTCAMRFATNHYLSSSISYNIYENKEQNYWNLLRRK